MIDMLSIDEVIQIENKITEENQKIVDTQIVFDNVSISELYCDDTEVIEEHLLNYRKCAEYHKHLVKWLEELKSYRQQYLELCKKYGVNTIEDLYDKAIDDFVKFANTKPTIETEDGEIRPMWLEEIAEQLKAGGENE